MDSNFQYASTMQAPSHGFAAVSHREAALRGAPVSHGETAFRGAGGSVRPAAAMRSTHREMRCSAAVQAAPFRAATRAAKRSAYCEARITLVIGCRDRAKNGSFTGFFEVRGWSNFSRPARMAGEGFDDEHPAIAQRLFALFLAQQLQEYDRGHFVTFTAEELKALHRLVARLSLIGVPNYEEELC